MLMLCWASLVWILVGAPTKTEAQGGERNRRYVWFNYDAPITMSFLLNLPVAFGLPLFAQPYLIPPNSLKGRSMNLLLEDRGHHDDEEVLSPSDLHWEPSYEEQLSRINAYLTHLQLHTLVCQERLICEVSAEPERYSPVSDILLKEVRQNNGAVRSSKDSLMWRYLVAARVGFTATRQDCAEAYPRCPFSADRVFNMPVLKMWQFVAQMFDMQLL